MREVIEKKGLVKEKGAVKRKRWLRLIKVNNRLLKE